MLKKLYKHEFYGLFRSLFLIYGGILLLAGFSKLMITLSSSLDNSYFQVTSVFSTMFYVIGIIALFIISTAVIVLRFYKHLLSSEGYLTFSLPVSATQHIICKLVCAITLMFIGAIITLISIFIMLIGIVDFADVYNVISELFSEAFQSFGTVQIALFITEYFIFIVISVIVSILQFYCAMAIGQNFINRVAGAVICYIILNAIVQVVEAFISIIALVIIQITGNFSVEAMSNIYMGPGRPLFLLAGILLQLILATTYFLITRHMLTKRLNLE